LVEIFQLVKRVLKPTGQCFINMGDSRLPSREWAGLPHKVVFALQDDGWRFEDEIVWAKPNPMPGSQTNRTTRSHEMLFMLNKSTDAFYDQEAIREPHQHDGRKATKAPLGGGAHSNYRGADGHERWPNSGRNRRSVWTIATQAFPGAHFATFAEKLVEPCILAGTSERGNCARCGKPWVRCVEKQRSRDGATPNIPGRSDAKAGNSAKLSLPSSQRQDVNRSGMGTPVTTTTGWDPSCSCKAPVGCQPAICLDPFAGSGTVGVVAQRLGRKCILIELSEPYCELAKRRLETIPIPMEV